MLFVVERFNLNADEVQEVFEEAREEKKAELQVRFEERLNQAVDEGKVTEEQKEAILAKKAEMREKHEELKDLSLEERHEAMKALQEEFKSWADENGIDLNQFFWCGGRKGHLGPKFGSWYK